MTPHYSVSPNELEAPVSWPLPPLDEGRLQKHFEGSEVNSPFIHKDGGRLATRRISFVSDVKLEELKKKTQNCKWNKTL